MTVTAIAHRGDPVRERENTLPAFTVAVALGADMVELDLRRTRDDEIVVLHDQTLQRLWGVDASVGDLDLAQVQGIGDGDLRIPTLREVLDAVPLPLMVDFTRREVVPGGLAAVLAEGPSSAPSSSPGTSRRCGCSANSPPRHGSGSPGWRAQRRLCRCWKSSVRSTGTRCSVS